MPPRTFILVLALAATGCGSSLNAVRFDGHAEDAVVDAEHMGEVSALPRGWDDLGEISAHCTYYEGARPPDGARLSDVDCSEARLVRAITEGAAEVGGQVLVGRRCHSHVLHEDDMSQRLSVSCRAHVGRPNADALASRSLDAPRPTAGDRISARDAWRIRVRFADTGKVLRAPRKVDYVREVPDMPVSHVRIGDVVTECDEDCNRAAVRHGVLVAAGRFGATDVVGVRCAERSSGYFCTGTATSYEIDPDLDPAAR